MSHLKETLESGVKLRKRDRNLRCRYAACFLLSGFVAELSMDVLSAMILYIGGLISVIFAIRSHLKMEEYQRRSALLPD